MAFGSDSVGLLFKVQADTAGAATAITNLRTSVNRDLDGMRSATTGLTDALSRIPLVGPSIAGVLGDSFGSVTREVKESADALKKFEALLPALQRSFQRNTPKDQITPFAKQSDLQAVLTGYKQLGDEAARTAYLTEIFGKEAAKVAPVMDRMAQGITTSSKSLAGFAEVATGAAIGFAALAASAVFVGIKLFDLAKSASDAGSEIYDLTVKSNLSAETLSALKVAAEQGGSSLEVVGAAATKFSASLVDAANGNKKLSEALARFGIDAKTAFENPDQALSTFITKFNSLPPSAEKNRDEMLLFKDRTGELLPVFDQIGGSFDEFKGKLEKLGLLMSNDEVQAADRFGDQLTELGLVSDRVGAKFASEFTPALTGSMRDIENALVGNTQSWINWGHQVSNVINGLRIMVRSLLNAGGDPLLTILGIPNAGREISNEDMMAVPDAPGGAGQFLGRNNRPIRVASGGGGGGAGRSGTNDAAREAAKAEREAQRAAAEAVRHATAEIQRDYAIRLVTLDEYRAKLEELAQTEYDNAITYGENTVAAENRLDEKKREIGEKYRNDSLALAREEFAAKEAVQAEADARTIDRLRDLEEQKLQTHEETENQILKIEAAARGRKLEALDLEMAAAEGDLLEKQKIQDQIDLLIEQGVTRAEEARRRVRDARQADLDDQKRVADEEQALAEKVIAQAEANARQMAEVAAKLSRQEQLESGAGQLFGGMFGSGFLDQINATQTRLEIFGQAMGNVFGTMASAVGSVVRNFVLLGGSGTSVRKFAAEVLASLASMAAVQALFELAMGFASLFLNPPKAAAHFTAAAIFGSIAGVAAVAGRAIAGDSFKQQTAAAGAVGTGGTSTGRSGNSGGGYYSSKDEESINQNRNGQLSKSDRMLTIVLKTDKGHTIDTIVENIRDAGIIRTLIQGQAA